MKRTRKTKRARQKQREKRFAKWFAAGSATFVLLAIGTLLFWHSNQSPPETITIYKSTPWTPTTPQQPVTTEIEPTDSVPHKHHPEDGHHHEPEGSETSADALPETVPINNAAPPDRDPPFSQEVADIEIAALGHDAALHATLERIGKEFKTILTEINEKYPEAREVMSISHEELHKRYPTRAARDALNERLDQMRAEYKDRAIQLLSELPTEMQLQLIIRIDEQIAKTHGDTSANEMTAELLDKLKL